MNSMMLLTTAARFEELAYSGDVDVKSSYVDGEYLTAVYKGSELLAERGVLGTQVEHFETVELKERQKRRQSRLP